MHIRSVVCFLIAVLLLSASAAASVLRLDQGPHWTAAEWNSYYTQDQGSRMIPLAWIAALKQASGELFLADNLSRYGYLSNPDSIPRGLPVGFTVANGAHGRELGMTCAACHSREIEVDGKTYRIDGGPAFADFQGLIGDLDKAVGKVLNDDAEFDAFAKRVLGPQASASEITQLREQVESWYLPYHTLMERALPQNPWGPARLDAVAMIFNRLAGLDIGPPPTYMIPGNIQPADAPVRYPFLWNAAIQDKTQWPGFADNGNSILGLARNLGEVYGVFADFKPKATDWRILGVDYLSHNSANFHGLDVLEQLIRKLGPPRWPWAVDSALADRGKAIYNRRTDQGGCVECHGIKPGKTRFGEKTWATPVMDVGTDSREYQILTRTVETGIMEGKKIPFLKPALKAEDSAANVLGTAVIGTILQHYAPVLLTAETDIKAALNDKKSPFNKYTEDLKGAFGAVDPKEAVATQAQSAGKFAYESRVLEGIWAAAPYLHNGSVPTLADLLKPAEQRPKSFKIGPNYDTDKIGLAVEQTRFDYTLETTGCEDRHSGNSRCGHEYGTDLAEADKRALLEYLKIL